MLHSLLLLTISALQAAEPAPAGWGKTLTIQLEAKRDRKNGDPWDASNVTVIPPLLHNVFFPLTAPAPDLMVCIVAETGESQCHYTEHRNAAGIPISLCPNEYLCNFASIAVPNGYYGVLAADMDAFGQNDFVVAAILYSGKKDPRRAFQTEQHLQSLARRWKIADAPREFLAVDADTCTLDTPCSPLGSAGWISLSETQPESCGFEIDATADATSAGSGLDLSTRSSRNACPGVTEYLWDFGDGSGQLTTANRLSHTYAVKGDYRASLSPRCRRQYSVCTGPQTSIAVKVK